MFLVLHFRSINLKIDTLKLLNLSNKKNFKVCIKFTITLIFLYV